MRMGLFKPLPMVLAGALHALSLAWPFASPAMQFSAEGLVAGQPVGWLNVVALALFARAIFACDTPRQAAGVAWWFTTSLLVGSWWWLYVSMNTYGGLHPVLAGTAVLALAGAVALLYAGAFFVYGLAVQSEQKPAAGRLKTQRVLAFAGAWLMAELARGTWFTGLPWGASGYGHVDGLLGKLAPWVGVYGLSILAALAAGLLASVLHSGILQKWPLAAVAAGFVGLLVMPQPSFTASTGSLAVTLLQGNIPQSEKFQANTGIPVALAWYKSELLAASTPLVMAPETAIPLLPQHLEPDYLPSLQAHFAGNTIHPERTALVGIPWGSRDGYTNSVLALGPTPTNGQLRRFDKYHLVPFGEYIPPFFKWFTDLLHIPLANFTQGDAAQPPLLSAGQRIAPNICYEDLFGEEMSALFRDEKAAPTILANFSNIAWFGNTIAIDQHRNISRMRSLEFERPMLRATNTGSTAIIDHRGRVVQELPRHTRGALVGQVEGRTGLTPYARATAAMGLWWLWAIAVLGLLGAWWVKKRY
jgi:apolipoprotein N-acyltransferase